MKRSVVLLISSCLFMGACTASRQQSNGQAAAGNTQEGHSSSLQSKRWILAGFPNETFEQPEKDVYILFEQDQPMVAGFGGCNGFRGSYEAGDRSLRIKELISTKMWCNFGPLEQQFMERLQTADSYLISGDSLQLIRQEKPVAYLYGVNIQ